MYSKILFSVVSALLLFVLFACGNNTTTPAPVAQVCLLKTLQDPSNNMIFLYDSQNRLIKRDSPNDSLYETFTYYNGDSIVGAVYNYDNVKLYSQKYVLNAQGYVSTSSGAGISTNTYTYDATGYLSQKTINATSTDIYTISGDNYTKSVFTKNDGTYTSTHTYTYYTNIEDKLKLFAPNESVLNIRFGKDTKNLLKSDSAISITSGITSTKVVDYTYEFDSDSRPTKITRIEKNNGGTPNTSVTLLTYHCQ